MAARYWVGGSGTWTSTLKWSATSGGATGASVPTAADDVYFDGASGLTAGGVVTIDTQTGAVCSNFNISMASLTVTTNGALLSFNIATTLTIVNSIIQRNVPNSTANKRILFRGFAGGTYAEQRSSLVIGSVQNTLTDIDFSNINLRGAAAPISGTRIGDVGGNSGIIFSTPKNVYWNYTGAANGTQNWNDSANCWSLTSGGTTAVNNYPLCQDTVIFDDNSTISINTGTGVARTIQCLTGTNQINYIGSVDMSARTKSGGSDQLNFTTWGTASVVHGNVKLCSSVTFTTAGATTFAGKWGAVQTIDSAGVTWPGNIIINSPGGVVQLARALTMGATSTFTITDGTFDTMDYNFTGYNIAMTAAYYSSRILVLRSSTVTLSSPTPFAQMTTSGAVIYPSTSQINLTSTTAITFYGGGLNYNNVSFTGATDGTITHLIWDANTFNNLTFAAPTTAGYLQYKFYANQTVTGAIASTGTTAVNRIWLTSDTIGTTRRLTAGSITVSDCDFRDITIAGTASGSSPTRAGNCGGNTGITFPTAKTVYWNLAGSQNWSATGWATTSGGTPAVGNFPLPQDIAVFDNAGSAGTINFDKAWNVSTISAGSRTSTMVLALATYTPLFYGSWTSGSGLSIDISAINLTFAGRGTSTITCNSVSFNNNIIIDCYTGIVQLGSNFVSSWGLTLTSGTFDAVTYDVVADNFSSSNSNSRSLKMGTGTWTLTSNSGYLWSTNTNTNLLFYKGTANIVLSNAGALDRTFLGGGLYFNKLTMGGAGSSNVIFDTSHFTELASTRTAAFAIDYATLFVTAITIGKWSVSGSAGNIVTVTGSPAITIAGSRVSDVNYLAMGTVTVPSTSPGEFYAGANSTGTNAGANGAVGSTLSGVILTAAPAPVTRYWIGGAGTWDATTTTNWSTASGGTGGASVPTSADAVIINAASGTTPYTITCTTGTVIRFGSLNMLNAGAVQIDALTLTYWLAHGSITFGATMSLPNFQTTIILSGSASSNILTTNGLGLPSAGMEVNGTGASWSLGSALTMGGGGLTVTNGSFDTGANYAVTLFGALTSSNSNARTIGLGASVVTLGQAGLIFGGATPLLGNVPDNLNFTVSITQSIVIGTSAAGAGGGFYGGGKTFYNVTLNGGGSIYGANTFLAYLNLSSTTAVNTNSITTLTLYANQNIRSFSYSPTSNTFNGGRRVLICSDTLGTQRTITQLGTQPPTILGWTDIDFRDIVIAGYPASGYRLGDCRNNSVPNYASGGTILLDANYPTSAGQSRGGLGITATSSNFVFAGDFTVEGWFYFNRYQSLTDGPVVGPTYSLINIGSGNGATGSKSMGLKSSGLTLSTYADPGLGTVSNAPGTIGVGWYHFAIARSGSVVTYYTNGQPGGAGSITGTVGDGNITFGSAGFDTSPNCYMKNLRVSNVAIYPSTALGRFTTLAFQPQTTLSVTQPALIGSYTSPNTYVGTNSGNMYSYLFDGTSNYLTVPYSSVYDIPASTPMTFECWVYTASASNFIIAGRNWNYGVTNPTWGFVLEGGINPRWAIAGTGQSSGYMTASSTLKGTLSIWNHYAFTRDANNVIRVFVNGILDITTVRTDSQAMTSASGDIYIGRDTASLYSNGNMSNMRLVVGTCLYTQNFMPITASTLTAVTNTRLLTLHASTITDGSSYAATIANPTSMTVAPPQIAALASNQTLLLMTVNDSASMLTDSSQYNVPITNNGGVYSNVGLPLNGIVFQAPRTMYMSFPGSQVWGPGNNTNLWVIDPARIGNVAANFSSIQTGLYNAIGLPLAQDTAVITSKSGITTLTIDQPWHIGNIDMSQAGTMTVAIGTQTPTFYGNITLGPSVTVTGTSALTFSGQGKTQNIISAGKTITQPITINSPNGGIVQTLDNFAMTATTGTLTLTQGTLIAKANVSLGIFSSANTNTRSIGFGTGTWTISGTGTMWNVTTTNLTTDPGSATISLTGAYAAAGVFNGVGGSWPKLSLSTAADKTTLSITTATAANASISSTSFTDIVNAGAPSLYKIITISGASTAAQGPVTVSSFNLKYAALNGNSLTYPGILTYTGNSKITGADGLYVNNVRAYGTTATTNASGFYISSTSNITILNNAGPGFLVSSSTPTIGYSVVVSSGVSIGGGVTIEGFSPPVLIPSFSYLVVAGGGAGGSGLGGGGGAGGVLIGTTAISYGVTYNIIVGTGGTPAVYDNIGAAIGGNGSQSQISGVATAVGGGGGGAYSGGGIATGLTGGSGGGAPGTGTGQGLSGAAGTAGQGTSGGGSFAQDGNGAGGGGGGADNNGTSGVSAKVGGAGGRGILNDYSGTATYYGGGGGGAGATTAGSGGSGSGGAGGYGSTTAGSGTAGTPNTGGGGGGGDGPIGNGGAGGSGIVIIRYPSSYPDAAIVTGATYTNTGVYKIYTWTTPNATSSGTIQF